MIDGGTLLLGVLVLAACVICWLGCLASEKRTKRNEEDAAAVLSEKLPSGPERKVHATRHWGAGR